MAELFRLVNYRNSPRAVDCSEERVFFRAQVQKDLYEDVGCREDEGILLNTIELLLMGYDQWLPSGKRLHNYGK